MLHDNVLLVANWEKAQIIIRRHSVACWGSGVVVGSPSTGALCKLMAQPLHPPQGLLQEARPDQL